MKNINLWVIMQIIYASLFGIVGIGEGIQQGFMKTGDFFRAVSFVLFMFILFGVSFFFGIMAAQHRVHRTAARRSKPGESE
jgi:hypothetical protein